MLTSIDRTALFRISIYFIDYFYFVCVCVCVFQYMCLSSFIDIVSICANEERYINCVFLLLYILTIYTA